MPTEAAGHSWMPKDAEWQVVVSHVVQEKSRERCFLIGVFGGIPSHIFDVSTLLFTSTYKRLITLIIIFYLVVGDVNECGNV